LLICLFFLILSKSFAFNLYFIYIFYQFSLKIKIKKKKKKKKKKKPVAHYWLRIKASWVLLNLISHSLALPNKQITFNNNKIKKKKKKLQTPIALPE
jgi:hypothetical protein